MGYPAAYRSGSAGYNYSAGDAAKAFKPPRGRVPPGFKPPTPANLPRLPAATKAEARLLLRTAARFSRVGRLIIRVSPWVSAAFLAYDIYEFMKNHPLGQHRSSLIPNPGQGWCLTKQCLAAGNVFYQYQLADTFGPCGSGNGLVCATDQVILPPSNGPLIPPNARQMYFVAFNRYFVGQPRHNAANTYWRPASTYLRSTPDFKVYHYPKSPIWLDPWDLPIKKPVDYPAPLPFNLTQHRLPDPLTRQEGNSEKDPQPLAPPRKPPTRFTGGSREKKMRMGGPLLTLFHEVALATTEAEDFISALDKALPKGLRAKGEFKDGRWWSPSSIAKAQAVGKHWNVIDWDKAIVNLIANHFGDQIVGRSSAKAQAWATKKGITLGLQG